MWFDGVRQPNTVYVASVSRGKDSTAMLRAIQLMGWPLDVVYSVDIWFDDETPAELPPLVAFKDEWDRRCYEQFGIYVNRVFAKSKGEKKTYCDIFYRKFGKNKRNGEIYGFPIVNRQWCTGELKQQPLNRVNFLLCPLARRARQISCGISG